MAGVRVVVFREDGAICCVRHGYGVRDWNVPGGGIDQGESVLDAAHREVLEGDAGPMPDRERERLSRVADATPATRLSCQMLVRDDLRLRVVNRLSESGLSDAGPRPGDMLDLDQSPVSLSVAPNQPSSEPPKQSE